MSVPHSISRYPGPASPSYVQVIQWAWGQHWFFNRNVERYGSPFRIRFPFLYKGKIVCFATTSAAKQILRLPAETAHAGEAYAILRQSTGPSAVIVLDEQEHLRLRKLLLPPLHGERLQQWTDFIAQRTLDDIATWPVGEPFSLRPITERITMSVISKIVFGVRDPARAEELRRLLPVLFDIPMLAAPGYITPLGRLDLGRCSPWGRYRRKRDRIDELLYAEITARRHEFKMNAEEDGALGARGDVLSMLLTARDEDGAPMSDRELRDQLVTMLVAGHETTATAIAWALERLLRTPRVLDRLLASLEADETEYLDAVSKETMRVRPVVAQIGRLLTEETVIDGWTVPAGTLVVLPMTVIHRDPEIYPEPKEFRPERFLEGNDPGGYAWLPFGGGLRRCPGASLAMLEMRVVLTAILRNVRLAPDRPEREKPRVRGITIVPSRGGRVVVRQRLTPAPRAKIGALAR
jgi:cytochrome P450 family 135